MMKTWQEGCEEHSDHKGVVTEQIILDGMQEEIDELRKEWTDYQEKMAKNLDELYEEIERLWEALWESSKD